MQRDHGHSTQWEHRGHLNGGGIAGGLLGAGFLATLTMPAL